MSVMVSLLSRMADGVAQVVPPNLAITYARNPIIPRLTKKLIERNGANIGDGARIKRSLLIDNALTDENSTGDFEHLNVGQNCYVGDEVYVDLAERIIIGDNVTISGQTSFITHADCNRSPWVAERFPRRDGPIEVNEGAWIGFGATILHGITIGERSVVAAGSLVREDVEPESVYAGTPARKIRDIE